MADREVPGWVKEHIRRYLDSDGEDGHIWNGVPTLLLTTTGRRSGKSRTTPLIYGKVQGEETYVIVASRGGATHHPSWYLNLVETPAVPLRVGSDCFDATARTASSDEKPSLWTMMAEIWPAFNEYPAKTDRVIPVVILERA
ncbi:MAG: nitroreductase family deazaflavin-dependent oxidoreductase [Caldilineaceae bacterium SB0675_bin_29]|uniref:Nitroreductase family deazaflavin-dependent oxidoreductase n=1 Tax=Caldilineaceae bacterium SB0675_bin_29 TaxID=2605266 RepID=A0A6B1FZI0_9CHLR|nr:nitroreductase family deazaflavin-dependent oxidoreductase [Caldilineaceae bacterium SB0675_bin_29]